MAPKSNFLKKSSIAGKQDSNSLFRQRAQPSSDKLSSDVTVMVLPVGRTYVALPVRVNLRSCFDEQIGVWDYSYGHENTREEPL